MKKICVIIVMLVMVIGCTLVCLNLGESQVKELNTASTISEETVLVASNAQVDEVTNYIDIEKDVEKEEFKNFTIGTIVVCSLLLISFVYEVRS